MFPQSIGKFKCRNEKSSKSPLNAYLSSCQRKPSDCGTVSRRTGDIMIECNPPNVINTSSSWSEWTSWTDKCNTDYGPISERFAYLTRLYYGIIIDGGTVQLEMFQFQFIIANSIQMTNGLKQENPLVHNIMTMANLT